MSSLLLFFIPNLKQIMESLESDVTKDYKVKSFDVDSVYIPVGHGFDTGEFFKLAKGCNLIVVEAYGSMHNWDIQQGQIREYTKLAAALKASTIFTNPSVYASEIIDILGPVAIYSEGQLAPDLEYKLKLDWRRNGNVFDIRYSGLIPLDTFMQHTFTTLNVVHKIPFSDGSEIDEENQDLEQLNSWIRSCKELFKFSIYPLPEMFSKFETVEGINDILEEFGRKRLATTLFDKLERTIRFFNGTTSNFGGNFGYFAQSLKNLMQLHPGTYLHMVCRTSTNELDRNVSKKREREMAMYRVPYMSERQLVYFGQSTKEYALSSEDQTDLLHRVVKHQQEQREYRKHNLQSLLLKTKQIDGGRRKKFTKKNYRTNPRSKSRFTPVRK